MKRPQSKPTGRKCRLCKQPMRGLHIHPGRPDDWIVFYCSICDLDLTG